MASLGGFGALTSVGGDLLINGNAALTSLSGFGALASVGEDLIISDNDVLTSLDGLGAITSAGKDLSIRSNDVLSECAVGLSGLISGAPPAFTGVTGSVIIESNAPDGACNSPQDVLDAAGDGPVAAEDDSALDLSFVAAPNPVSGTGSVSFGLSEATDVRVSLYDALGREVAVVTEGPRGVGRHTAWLDASALPAGVYVVRAVVGAEARPARLTVVR